jgi:hypothetical protein
MYNKLYSIIKVSGGKNDNIIIKDLIGIRKYIKDNASKSHILPKECEDLIVRWLMCE